MQLIRVVDVRKLRTVEQRMSCVYVGRKFAGWNAHPLANPYKPKSYGIGGQCQTAMDNWRNSEIRRCLAGYRMWLGTIPNLEEQLKQLWQDIRHGEIALGCWCVNATHGDGQPIVCHAQILAEMLTERFVNKESDNATHV